MNFCKKCGLELENDAVFCPGCGAPAGKTPPARSPADPARLDKTMPRSAPLYGVLNLENLPVGHIIDERYQIKAKLGQGGFGAVYRVFDKKMKIDKALKIFPEAVSNDRRAMQNLRREAQTMIRLNHNNIVRVYDFHEEGPVKYIDMEYIDGKNLSDVLSHLSGQKMPENIAKQMALKIAEALAYAHHQNVIHRDIKPQNIMVTQAGELKLMDFGIAETVRTSMSRIANVSTSGTLFYMSPEQVLGEAIGKEADIYSFGATLYELLSGHPPFSRGDISYQILHKEPALIPDISADMNAFLQKCLRKVPKERYGSCEEVLESLQGRRKTTQREEPKPAAAVHRVKEGASTPVIAKKKPWPRWLLPGVGILLLLLLGLFLFGIFQLKRWDEQQRREAQRLTEQRKRKQFIKSLGIEMIYVSGGTFEMGDTFGDGKSDEKPVHQVTVKSFYMSKYEVTQAEYQKVMGTNPSYFKGATRPVEKVSWYDAVEFCNRLSLMEELTVAYHIKGVLVSWDINANGYRLPTEAEWEYAAREGGKKVRFGNGKNIADPAEINFDGSSRYKESYSVAGVFRKKTLPVGSFAPNALGIYDMSGNVWEWIWDRDDEKYYSSGPQNNPRGPSSGTRRVLRGGGWISGPHYVRCADRGYIPPDDQYNGTGFRLLRTK